MEIVIKKLTKDNFKETGLDSFDRSQNVKKVYRRNSLNEFTVVKDQFTFDWSENQKRNLAIVMVDDKYDSYGVFSTEDELLGFVTLKKRISAKRMIVEALYVSLPYRKQGIGRKLLTLAIEEAVMNDAKEVYFSVPPFEDTVNFFLDIGAVITPYPIATMETRDPDNLQMVIRLR